MSSSQSRLLTKAPPPIAKRISSTMSISSSGDIGLPSLSRSPLLPADAARNTFDALEDTERKALLEHVTPFAGYVDVTARPGSERNDHEHVRAPHERAHVGCSTHGHVARGEGIRAPSSQGEQRRGDEEL